MKKIILKSTLAVVLVFLLGGCSAAHFGTMSNSASLDSANFSYVKQNIKGKSQATYVFGIGGLAKESLVNEAKQKMLAENPLKDNQALANLTVSYKGSHYLMLFGTMECTITADVVQFK
jgi:hypothetical protein